MYIFALLAEIINVYVANVYEHVFEPLSYIKSMYYCTNTKGFVPYYSLRA